VSSNPTLLQALQSRLQEIPSTCIINSVLLSYYSKLPTR
jgi:hypothetical protein